MEQQFVKGQWVRVTVRHWLDRHTETRLVRLNYVGKQVARGVYRGADGNWKRMTEIKLERLQPAAPPPEGVEPLPVSRRQELLSVPEGKPEPEPPMTAAQLEDLKVGEQALEIARTMVVRLKPSEGQLKRLEQIKWLMELPPQQCFALWRLLELPVEHLESLVRLAEPLAVA
jgi:hypothetical protein